MYIYKKHGQFIYPFFEKKLIFYKKNYESCESCLKTYTS